MPNVCNAPESRNHIILNVLASTTILALNHIHVNYKKCATLFLTTIGVS